MRRLVLIALVGCGHAAPAPAPPPPLETPIPALTCAAMNDGAMRCWRKPDAPTTLSFAD